MKTVRIFISSPGDVAKERERAREVVESLRRRFSRHFMLQPVLWEDLPLQSDTSFQLGIDTVLSENGVDIAIFILWSRLGSPVGHAITKPDGTHYRSGTEREYDLIIQARATSLEKEGRARPDILVYTRRDDASFEETLRGTSTEKKDELIQQKKRVEAFLAETFRDRESGHNIGAYFPFDRPVTFSQRLRVHLQGLLDQMAGESTEVIWDTDKLGPPFLGLEAFQARHAPVFFGREEEILEARHALKEQARDGCAFLLLSGASGSGKSSLARAGVLPAIAELELDEQIAGWRCVVLTPSQLGADPIAALVAHLAADDMLPALRDGDSSLPDLVDGLKKDPDLTFKLRLKDAFAKSSVKLGGSLRLLLVIDQLEELFTTPDLTADNRAAFLAVVETFARSGSVWVLATVRSDFYQHVQSEPALVRMKSGHGQLDVLSPGPDALQRLIEEPARLAGLAFENRDDQALSSRILKDAATHAELLPLVEFVLRELYENRDATRQLTFDAYEALGGVEGALAKRADDTYQSLPGDAQESLPTVLQALVTLGNDTSSTTTDGSEKFVRQRADLTNFDTKPAAKQFVEAFIDARLFTTCQIETTGDPAVTVAHESLLRVWPRAKAWAENNKELLSVRARIAWRIKEKSPLMEGDPLLETSKHHVTTNAEAFTADQRTFISDSVLVVEARKLKAARLRRVVMASLALLAIAALLGAAFGFWNAAEAGRQQKAALQEKEKAEQATNWMEIEKTAALEAKRIAEKKVQDASIASVGAAINVWNEDINSRSLGNVSLSSSGTSKWQEALAHLAKAVRIYPRNKPALRMAYDMLINGSSLHVQYLENAIDIPLSTQAKEAGEFQGKLSNVIFSPDGRSLSVQSAGRSWLIDVQSRTIATSTDGNIIGFTSDSKLLLCRVSNTKTVTIKTTPPYEQSVLDSDTNGIPLDEDIHTILESNENTVEIIDRSTGLPLFPEVLEAKWAHPVTSFDHAYAWDGLSNMSYIHDFSGHKALPLNPDNQSYRYWNVGHVTFSHDSATAWYRFEERREKNEEQSEIRILNLKSGKAKSFFNATQLPEHLAISWNDEYLAGYSSWDRSSPNQRNNLPLGNLIVWNTKYPDKNIQINLNAMTQGEKFIIKSCVWHPRKSLIALISDTGIVRFYEIFPHPGATDFSIMPLGGPYSHARSVNWIAFSPNGNSFVTSCDDGELRFWRMPTKRYLTTPLAAFMKSGENGYHLIETRISTTGKQVIAFLMRAEFDGKSTNVQIRIEKRDYDGFSLVDSWTLPHMFSNNDSGPQIYLSDDERLFSVVEEHPKNHTVIHICNMQKKELFTLSKHEENTNSYKSIIFSPDGKYLLDATLKSEPRLWMLSHQPLQIDITGMNNKTIVAEDAFFGECLHKGNIAWSADSRYFAGPSTSSEFLWICDAKSGKIITGFKIEDGCENGIVDQLCFANHDKQLLANIRYSKGGSRIYALDLNTKRIERILEAKSQAGILCPGRSENFIVLADQTAIWEMTSPAEFESMASGYQSMTTGRLSGKTAAEGSLATRKRNLLFVPRDIIANEASMVFYTLHEDYLLKHNIGTGAPISDAIYLPPDTIEGMKITTDHNLSADGNRMFYNQLSFPDYTETNKDIDGLDDVEALRVADYLEAMAGMKILENGAIESLKLPSIQKSLNSPGFTSKRMQEFSKWFLKPNSAPDRLVIPYGRYTVSDISDGLIRSYRKGGTTAEDESDLKKFTDVYLPQSLTSIRFAHEREFAHNKEVLRSYPNDARVSARYISSGQLFIQSLFDEGYWHNAVKEQKSMIEEMAGFPKRFSACDVGATNNNLSWYYLHTKEWDNARIASLKAIELDPTMGNECNLAHAHMFAGDFVKSVAIHQKWHDRNEKLKTEYGNTWEKLTADDFARFREAGLDHPDMKRVEKLLGIENGVTGQENAPP